MGMDVSNFYAINTIDKGNGQKGFYFHEYRNDNGKAAELVTMGDGFGDAKEAAKSFIDRGFDPDKIKINGQLASDIFGKEDNKPAETKELTGFAKFKAKAHNFIQKLKTSLASITKFMPKTTTGMDSSVMLANQQNQLMMEQINQQNFINQLNQDNMLHMQAMGMM